MPQVKISHRKVNAICCIYIYIGRGGGGGGVVGFFVVVFVFVYRFVFLILYVVVVVFLPGVGGRVSWLAELMGEDGCFFFRFFFPSFLLFLCSAISH